LAARLLLLGHDSLFHQFQVGKNQLEVDSLRIPNRIYFAMDMGNIVIVKATHHVGDSLDTANVGQEHIAKSFAFRCPFHEPGDIDKFNSGGNDFVRCSKLC